jgi:vacuolar-type H+-ATPase subunit E/Vma4
MGLENILSEIENNRRQRIDTLRQEYDRKTGELIISTEKRIDSIRKESEVMLSEQLNAVRAKYATALEIEERRIFKERKDHLISEALLLFDDLATSFYKTKEYKKLLTSMIKSARDLLGKDCKIFAFESDIESLGETKGLHKFQKGGRFSGGIFAVSSDGKKELDLTMDTIMAAIRENLIAEVAERIGGE